MLYLGEIVSHHILNCLQFNHTPILSLKAPYTPPCPTVQARHTEDVCGHLFFYV